MHAPPFLRRTQCSVEGCGRRHCAKGYCATHLKRHHAGLSMVAPIGPSSEKRPDGATRPRKDGYVEEKRAGGWKVQHRWRMEDRLGRELLPDETVHHINGVRDDNRPENLELWSSSHPSGQRVEDKLAHARMLIDRYEAKGRYSR